MSRYNTQVLSNIRMLCRMQNIDEKVLYERAKLILSIYREVCWSTIDRANDVCDTLICTYGDSLDGALIYLENFAPDEARERFEERIRSLFETPEMGRMLGLGKTESYWLIKKNYFKTILVGNTMRVMIDSFEEWYANQFKYQKVDGTPPGEELKKTTYSMEELGQRLGLKEATAYELVAKGHFDVVDVLGKRRVTKESFERWYASQTDYRTVEDQELDADIMASTYGLPEMARMLGVHRQTIYYIVANEDFELIKVGRYKRATKESFEKWYQNQTRYQLVEDRQERS